MSAQRSEVQFSRKKTILYSVLLTSIGLGVIEGGARFAQPGLRTIPSFLVRQIDTDIELPFMEADPELFWKPAPGFSGAMWGGQVTINDVGQRQHATALSGTPSRRLLCFGDSITFGYGVSDQDTYPAALADALKRLGVEVRNAGVTGYTSYQTLRWLGRQLKNQRIDDVTLLIGWNDLTRRPITDAEFGRRLRYSTTTTDRALGHLAVYRMMKAMWLRRGLEPKGQEATPSTARVPLEDYASNLEMFVAEARAAGARPHLIALPSRLLPGALPRQTEYSTTLEAVARRLSVPLYDVGILNGAQPAIQGHDNASYFIDSLHLSPEGNRLMATRLASQLEKSIR